MSTRAHSVLCAVVELYIRTGEPVASRLVARHCGLGLSSATIRCVTAELEDGGFLNRPHTSAGSMPSDLGFRQYVNNLPRGETPPPAVRREISARMGAMRRDLEEDISWIAELLADATREAGVAVRPVGEGPVLEAVSLVLLNGSRVLGVIVTDNGSVDKRVLDVDGEPSREELQRVANFLTRQLAGTELDRIAAKVETLVGAELLTGEAGLRKDVLRIARRLFTTGDVDVEVRIVGTENLLSSEEFAEVERVRLLLSTLQDRSRIASELRRAFTRGRTQVLIGDESTATAPGGLGIVASLYFRERRKAGAIGVVGPRRLDYQKVVPVVKYIGETLTEMLDKPRPSHA